DHAAVGRAGPRSGRRRRGTRRPRHTAHDPGLTSPRRAGHYFFGDFFFGLGCFGLADFGATSFGLAGFGGPLRRWRATPDVLRAVPTPPRSVPADVITPPKPRTYVP